MIRYSLGLTLAFLALILLVSACNLPGGGNEWYVSTIGDDENDCRSVENACLTIQAAIDKSPANGTIFISSGTYDSFWISIENGVDKHLQLIGAGPGETIITSNFRGSVVVNNESTTILDSMTIKNGSAFSPFAIDGNVEGGGVFNRGGYLVINNSHIIENEGSGVTSINDGRLVITNSTISDNLSNNAGGIYMIGGNLGVANSIITDNHSETHGGGISIHGEGPLSISGSTISRNSAVFNGGGIRVGNCEQVSIIGSTIEDNSAESNGGGIALESDRCAMSISGTIVSSNSADGWGGGIAVWGGSLTLTNSVVSNNLVRSSGGGIVFDSLNEACGEALISTSTIFGNEALVHSGGGIYHQFCPMIITNTTISSNRSGGRGGGIYEDGPITINSSTIAKNRASLGGEGIHVEGALGLGGGGRGLIINTILAYNGEENCAGEQGNILSGGHNLDSGNDCGFNSPGDLVFSDPVLGPLADNGGDTLTHALLPGSPAIDAGDNPNCPVADQRGVARPQGVACDIGAYESEDLPIQPPPTQQEGASTQPAPTALGKPTVTATQDANCRKGPGTAYGVKSSLLTGQTAPITGRNTDSSWWVIQNPGSADCWIWDGIVTVGGDISGVPVITPPPVPTATFTQLAPLTAPNPSSPNGTLTCADASGGVTLNWSAVSHSNSIDYYEWTLEGPINDSGSTGNTQASTKTLSCAGANFQWRVRAVDGKGNIGPWSNYLQFIVP